MDRRLKEDAAKRFERVDSTNAWSLFELPENSSGDWASLKLVIPRERNEKRRKTRFWFGWHVGERRLSRVNDTAALEVMFPEIHAEVMDSLTGYFDG